MTPRGPGRRRRGRRIARTAVVGGAAYHAGKSRQANSEQETSQDQQQPAPQPVSQSAAASPDITVEIQKLADLKASGALSEEEFVAAKAKLLGT